MILGGKCCETEPAFSTAFQRFPVASVSPGDKHMWHPCRQQPWVFLLFICITHFRAACRTDKTLVYCLTHRFQGSPGEKEFPTK